LISDFTVLFFKFNYSKTSIKRKFLLLNLKMKKQQFMKKKEQKQKKEGAFQYG